MRRTLVGVAVALFVIGIFVTPASAQTLRGSGISGEVMPSSEEKPPTNAVLPETETRDVTPAAEAPAALAPAAEAAPTSTGGQLPFTGADVVELTVIGAAAIGIGTLMVRRSRARANA